jgi:hypothetical protein
MRVTTCICVAVAIFRLSLLVLLYLAHCAKNVAAEITTDKDGLIGQGNPSLSRSTRATSRRVCNCPLFLPWDNHLMMNGKNS